MEYQDMSLEERIDYAITNNKDKCTTDADIRYFETTAYYRAEALEAWREDHYGSSEGFNEAYGS
tara:strand:+ start:298 stop:489 length:192 start_codon:yes stop_codon:yes gene_type:complete